MKSTGRKAKKERRILFFHSVRGRDVTRVYSQREYERNVHFLLFFTSYLVGSCLLSSAKGASLRCRKKRGFQGNVRKQARGVFERTIAGETYMAPIRSIL